MDAPFVGVIHKFLFYLLLFTNFVQIKTFRRKAVWNQIIQICRQNLLVFNSNQMYNHFRIKFGQKLSTGPTRWNKIILQISSNCYRGKFRQTLKEIIFFMCLLLFFSCFSGHFWSAFLVILLLAVKRSRRTTKSDLKYPE